MCFDFYCKSFCNVFHSKKSEILSYMYVGFAGIVVSNPAGCWCECCVLCVVRWRSLRRSDHSSRGVVPTAVRRCVWSKNLKKEEAMASVGLQRHRGGGWGGGDVFIALGIQHAMRMHRIILSSVTCPAIPYIPTLSQKWHNFRKKNISEDEMCFYFLYYICPKECSF